MVIRALEDFDAVWDPCIGEARALQTTLLGHFGDERNLVPELPKKSALDFGAVLAKNQEIAYHRFSAVLLAHLLIFKEFLLATRVVHATAGDEQKRLWLLLQL
ncbi:hypothetical protein H0H87_000775 [Tephrocybe sp. NHM501043]|nr:hypothetical protein H0H87_000775 [Tephrocybe sp. NHM501043]